MIIDTKNPRALFVIEDENNQPLVTFNSDTEKNPIKLRNMGVENDDNSLYYDQYYTPFGRNVETLSIETLVILNLSGLFKLYFRL